MNRLLLVDSDLFIVLAASGLLPRTAELLGCPMEQVRRLQPLPHMLRGSKRLKKEYPEAIREAALQQADAVAPIIMRPANDGLLERLVQVQNIDEGEALLLGLLVENEAFFLTSGDLKAMRALGNRPRNSRWSAVEVGEST